MIILYYLFLVILISYIHSKIKHLTFKFIISIELHNVYSKASSNYLIIKIQIRKNT